MTVVHAHECRTCNTPSALNIALYSCSYHAEWHPRAHEVNRGKTLLVIMECAELPVPSV